MFRDDVRGDRTKSTLMRELLPVAARDQSDMSRRSALFSRKNRRLPVILQSSVLLIVCILTFPSILESFLHFARPAKLLSMSTFRGDADPGAANMGLGTAVVSRRSDVSVDGYPQSGAAAVDVSTGVMV